MPKLIDNLYMKDSSENERQIADTDGNLYQTGTRITATATEINQVCDGISVNVTATNLNTLTDGVTSTSLHKHTLANGATDVTATAAELNTLDGITATVSELNQLDGVAGAVLAAISVGKKVAYGVNSVTGSADIASGLATVENVYACLKGNPNTAAGGACTATADLSVTPGNIVLKGWDSAFAAATVAHDIFWIAIGT